MAKANSALMQHRLGRTCEATRNFQLLGAGSKAPLQPWLREPYETFERSLAEKPLSAEDMACALGVTEDHRTFGVCPYVNGRIQFAYNRADVDANNRSKVEGTDGSPEPDR